MIALPIRLRVPYDVDQSRASLCAKGAVGCLGGRFSNVSLRVYCCCFLFLFILILFSL